MKTPWPDYGAINGPIVMIGFGSIGRGTLPLIERHFDFDSSRFTGTPDAAADGGRGSGFLRQSLG